MKPKGVASVDLCNGRNNIESKRTSAAVVLTQTRPLVSLLSEFASRERLFEFLCLGTLSVILSPVSRKTSDSLLFFLHQNPAQNKRCSLQQDCSKVSRGINVRESMTNRPHLEQTATKIRSYFTVK